MLGHLEMWIFHILKKREQLDKYNAISLSVPAYPDVTTEISHTKQFLNGMGRI
jgi:hypothetical protein